MKEEGEAEPEDSKVEEPTVKPSDDTTDDATEPGAEPGVKETAEESAPAEVKGEEPAATTQPEQRPVATRHLVVLLLGR